MTAKSWGHKGSDGSENLATGAEDLYSGRETATSPDGLADSWLGDEEAEAEAPRRRQAVTCHCAGWHQLEVAAHSSRGILEEEHRVNENEQEALVARAAHQLEQDAEEDASATQRYAPARAVRSPASGVEWYKVRVGDRARDRQVGS